MYELNAQEHAAVLQLNADYRQAHFLGKVKEHQEIYLLSDSEGPFLLEDQETDDEGNLASMLPVWCHPAYAEDFIKNSELTGCEVKGLPLKTYKEAWLPFLTENKLLLALMPLGGDEEFNVIEPGELCAEGE